MGIVNSDVRGVLETEAAAIIGSRATGWTETLVEVTDGEVSNRIWKGYLDGRVVFVKQLTTISSCCNEMISLKLAQRANVPVPEIVLVSTSQRLVVTASIDGMRLSHVWDDLDTVQKTAICELVGEASARLHFGAPGCAFGVRPGASIPTSNRTWKSYASLQVAKWALRSREILPPEITERTENALSAYIAGHEFVLGPSLVQYDIAPRNVILRSLPNCDAVSSSVSLLDFEHAAYDHPCMDYHNSLGAKWIQYEPELCEAFWRGVDSEAPPQHVAECKAHSEFFKGMVALGTIAYLAKVGVSSTNSSFFRTQLSNLTSAVVSISEEELARNATV